MRLGPPIRTNSGVARRTVTRMRTTSSEFVLRTRESNGDPAKVTSTHQSPIGLETLTEQYARPNGGGTGPREVARTTTRQTRSDWIAGFCSCAAPFVDQRTNSA